MAAKLCSAFDKTPLLKCFIFVSNDILLLKKTFEKHFIPTGWKSLDHQSYWNNSTNTYFLFTKTLSCVTASKDTLCYYSRAYITWFSQLTITLIAHLKADSLIIEARLLFNYNYYYDMATTPITLNYPGNLSNTKVQVKSDYKIYIFIAIKVQLNIVYWALKINLQKARRQGVLFYYP